MAKKTQSINCKDKDTWVKLYYSVREDRVFSEEGECRYFMTNLINPQSEKDIEEAVHVFMNM